MPCVARRLAPEAPLPISTVVVSAPAAVPAAIVDLRVDTSATTRRTPRHAPTRASLSAHAALHPSHNVALATAQCYGLEATFNTLAAEAQRRLGWTPAQLAQITNSVIQVIRATPIGFVGPGRPVSWPPNQSEGRGLGLRMTRTLLVDTNVQGQVIKVKGAGQAYDHPDERQQRINDSPRPPIPYAAIWGRDYLRTGTVQFGSQRELAEDEFVNLLVLHEVSLRLFGALAAVPLPLAIVPVEHVTVGEQAMTLVRAHADVSVWTGHETYFGRHQADLFQRVQKRRPEALRGAATLDAFLRLAGEDPHEEQAALSQRHAIEAARQRPELYAHLVLAEAFVASHPLAQLQLLERSQFRNNVPHVWNDNALADAVAAPGSEQKRFDLLDALLAVRLASWGITYQPPPRAGRGKGFEAYHAAALAPYSAAIRQGLQRDFMSLGRTYGTARGLGAELSQSFHPKDIIGGEVTDWLDAELPGPRQAFSGPSAAGWRCYNNGLAQNLDVTATLFRLDSNSKAALQESFERAARDACTRVRELGRTGALNDLLGDSAERYRAWTAGSSPLG